MTEPDGLHGMRIRPFRDGDAAAHGLAEVTRSTRGPSKLVWCTERRTVMEASWLAFAVITRRLIGEGSTRYRREGRPCRKP